MAIFASISWLKYVRTPFMVMLVFIMSFTAKGTSKPLCVSWKAKLFSLRATLIMAKSSSSHAENTAMRSGNFVSVRAKVNCKDSAGCAIVTKKNTWICRPSVICVAGSYGNPLSPILPDYIHLYKQNVVCYV